MRKNENIPNSSLFDSMGSVPSVGVLILLFSLSAAPTLVFGQRNPAPPAFYQIVERTYGIPEGLPDPCIKSVLIDSNGRLHLAACNSYYASSSLHMYDFDGTQAYPSGYNLDHNPIGFYLGDQIARDIFYGFYRYRNEEDSIRHAVFQYHAITGITQSYDVQEHDLVQSVAEFGGALFACIYERDTRKVKIVRFKDNTQSILFSFYPVAPPDFMNYEIKLAVTENDFWVAQSAGHIYRINRKAGTQRQYALPGVEDAKSPVIQAFAPPGNGVWINCEGINFWDATTNRFVKNPYMPNAWKGNALKSAYLSSDLKHNMLIWYTNVDSVSSATLVDNRQQAFDYTPLTRAGARGAIGSSRRWMSNDYKQGIIFFLPNLRFVEFTPYNAVQNTLDFKHNRTIVQLAKDTIYAGRHGVLYNENGTWKSTGRFLHPGGLGDKDIKKDRNGNIWYPVLGDGPKANYFLRFQKGKALPDTISVERGFGRYDFLGDHHITFEAHNELYLLDTKTQKTQLLSGGAKLNLDDVNQLFVCSNSLIWVACNNGLFKFDPRTAEHQWIDLKGKTTVIRIYEDKRGRLWLGTIVRGILIYDPSNGNVKAIDQKNGLSNNLVVNLLEDEDGVIWAGTYHGISLLSPEGVVIGKIYQEDGLAEDECNRWSAMRMDDGRLCFGSNAGLSFIDPKLLKKRIQEGTPPRIYLTGLSNKVPGESFISTDLLPRFEQNERIVLPAENRNLNINFALSNYIAPEKSMFAYMIEGRGEEWNYIGNQRQLALNALPAGKYNILIKGADGWGRWSAQPIIIPVTVREYFFKTWWAFGLLALVILTPLYFIRKYQIRQLLEHAENQRLHEIDSLKTKLYTNITHEFRTPLTVISGMADMIDKKPDTAKKLIKRNSQSLLRLVNQILDLAKLESGHLRLQLIQADVVPYVQYLMESLQSFAEQKNIKLVFHSEQDQLTMDFDEKKLEAIVTNLLSNAIKFSRDGGEINVNLRESQGRLLLSVKDNGIGIAPDKLPHIFERFYQAGHSEENKNTLSRKGSGIGLTLSKELVELMKGEITVESSLAEGTIFTVSLPIDHQAPAIALESVAPITLPTPIDISKADGQEHSVADDSLPILLLIEDNPDVAAYLMACLEGRYTTEWAENGAIGIEKALETIPDAIISDVMMPEKDGFEVCQTLKNDERTSHIPIILLTAKVDVASKLEGLGVGADAYLAKPFLKEELFIRLDNLVELRQNLQARYAGKSDLSNIENAESLPTEPTLDDLFLQKVRNLIEANLDDAEFGNAQLASVMLLSESQLFRKLKALTGHSIAIHIRSIRLHKGKEMLQNTDMTISEIAYETGFSDPSYFSRTFSKEFGMSPSEIRK